MQVLPLVCHPSTPCAIVSSLSVRVDRLDRSADEHRIVCYYELEGDIDALQLPAPRRSARGHELWRHTCFEAFVRAVGAREYLELNFSPSSEWAAYRFEDYRRGMAPISLQPPPRIVCRRREQRLEADVKVRLARSALAGAPAGAPAGAAGDPQDARQSLQLAIAVVLEDLQQRLYYWALAHPSGQPDFHHEQGYVLTLHDSGVVDVREAAGPA